MELKPAPNEREQRSDRLKLIKKLNILENDLSKRAERRRRQIADFGSHAGGQIAYSIYRETAVHVDTLEVVTTRLLRDYNSHLESRALSPSAELYQAQVTIDTHILDELTSCVELMGVDDAEQLRKLGLTVLSKGAKLSGAGSLIAAAELVEAVKDITDSTRVKHEAERSSAHFLMGLEFFMYLSLWTVAFAATAVGILTKPFVQKHVENNAEADFMRVRSDVTKTLLEVREAYSKVDPKPMLVFPNEGMWMDAKTA